MLFFFVTVCDFDGDTFCDFCVTFCDTVFLGDGGLKGLRKDISSSTDTFCANFCAKFCAKFCDTFCEMFSLDLGNVQIARQSMLIRK